MSGLRKKLSLSLAGLLLCATGCAGGSKLFAKVDVETTPPSAEVWLGHETVQRDSSPCTLLFPEAGEFEVHLKKAGYMTVLKRVTIVEREAEGKRTLEALPPNMIVTLDPIEGEGGTDSTGPSDTPYYDE